MHSLQLNALMRTNKKPVKHTGKCLANVFFLMQICAIHVINIVCLLENALLCSNKVLVMEDYMLIKEPNEYSSLKCLNKIL